MLDSAKPRDAAIAARLESDLIIWLTTVRPDGRPHTVPVWFWWDGESITIFCEPATTKIRNLSANPHVTLALETRDEGEEVIFFEGVAELTAEPTAALMTPAYAAKYAHLFPRIDSNPETMAARYTQPVRVKPAKVFAWGIPD